MRHVTNSFKRERQVLKPIAFAMKNFQLKYLMNGERDSSWANYNGSAEIFLDIKVLTFEIFLVKRFLVACETLRKSFFFKKCCVATPVP